MRITKNFLTKNLFLVHKLSLSGCTTIKLNMMKKLFYVTLFFLGAFTINTQAQCVKGNCYNGKGTFQYTNGDKYDGQWKDGKMHGIGLYEFANGDRYKGDFHVNKREGTGTYVWKNKGRYVGEWKADKRHGHGVFYWPSSAQYNGFWQEDQIINMDVSTVTDSQEVPLLGN